jgi:heavy metal translocating P-type ATPase
VKRFAFLLRPSLVTVAGLGLVLGLLLHVTGRAGPAGLVWTAATLPVLAALLWEIATSLRRGEYGLDIVAALSMTGALLVGETLAAAVVALMYSGGQYLEAFAERRARREMTALLERVPRTAMRHRNGGLEEVPLEAIAPGDRLLIRRGDVVPVDGRVEGVALLDEAPLTGEALPVRHERGSDVMSGPANVGDAFDLVAERRAEESTYAGIVRLVEQAHRSKAPMVRLADRYAMVFLAVTVAMAVLAWGLSGDPVRAVAVLVVATPCPLILAVPVALVAGLSRAAKQGILIKGVKALETMARVAVVVLDKTGTLTEGRPHLIATDATGKLPPDEVLRLGASLDQASKHTIAQTIVAEARARGLTLSVPSDVAETAGDGVEGLVEGRRVIVGGAGFVAARLGRDRIALPHGTAGALGVAVAVDGELAGVLTLADRLRSGTGRFMEALRALGVDRIVLATGDRHNVAEATARGLPFTAIRSELSPDEKVLVVLSERKHGPVMMVGDGVNDAPALAAADLGVAMGARGAAASAEAADVVLLVDRLDRLAPGLAIARRARRIALQSVIVGLGLSFLGMIAAALGYLTPVQGALLQEVIDVAVILNALRSLGGGREEAPRTGEPRASAGGEVLPEEARHQGKAAG